MSTIRCTLAAIALAASVSDADDGPFAPATEYDESNPITTVGCP